MWMDLRAETVGRSQGAFSGSGASILLLSQVGGPGTKEGCVLSAHQAQVRKPQQQNLFLVFVSTMPEFPGTWKSQL